MQDSTSDALAAYAKAHPSAPAGLAAVQTHRTTVFAEGRITTQGAYVIPYCWQDNGQGFQFDLSELTYKR